MARSQHEPGKAREPGPPAKSLPKPRAPWCGITSPRTPKLHRQLNPRAPVYVPRQPPAARSGGTVPRPSPRPRPRTAREPVVLPAHALARCEPTAKGVLAQVRQLRRAGTTFYFRVAEETGETLSCRRRRAAAAARDRRERTGRPRSPCRLGASITGVPVGIYGNSKLPARFRGTGSQFVHPQASGRVEVCFAALFANICRYILDEGQFAAPPVFGRDQTPLRVTAAQHTSRDYGTSLLAVRVRALAHLGITGS